MKIFDKVRCKAYMQKTSDGVHIVIYDRYNEEIDTPFGTATPENKVSENGHIDGSQTILAYQNDKVLKDLSSCEGESVYKTYRKRTECEFEGVLVGITRINCGGEIGTDWNDGPYREYGYCFKNITYKPKVGVVYFRNNCKRYVLMDDMEVIDDNQEGNRKTV